ncbi:MAG: DUF3786 domain-containing protein [Desulfobacterales bacterium]|nr:DUF3786 domain-containing protein [Desulfobacterales bacterium]
MKQSPIFEKTYRNYLSQIKFIEKKSITVPFFGKQYIISEDGIYDSSNNKPIFALCVLLCRYIIFYPTIPSNDKDLVSYKDFKDAAPFVEGFVNNTEKAIVKNFSGKKDELILACQKIGGTPILGKFSYDVAMRFDALPKIPVFLLFNDKDEEFDAHCSVLFEKCVKEYLDMECLALIGWLLADHLLGFNGFNGCNRIEK